MALSLECPACHREFTVGKMSEGGTTRCPKCNRSVVLRNRERQGRFDEKLAASLVDEELITPQQLETIRALHSEYAERGENRTLTDLLLERNFVTRAQIRQTLGFDGEMPPPDLSGYRVDSRLGGGGMGTVYNGVHLASGKSVAIKVLADRLSRRKNFVERFHREARVAIDLDHPHIVKGFDVGEENNRHYFVMEFVEGKAVSRVLAKRPHFGERRTLHIGRQIADALGYAHARGLVHRDIKPDNILLMRDGTAKLADYGLVKMADDETLVHLTATGEIMGTPYYLSPEQAAGEEEIDIRSDLYSLGATLYHMATGAPPYSGGSGAEIMAQHLYGRLRDPRDHNPRLSARCAEMLKRLLARSPAERYQTPGELTDAITHYFEGQISEPKDSDPEAEIDLDAAELDEEHETPMAGWFTTPSLKRKASSRWRRFQILPRLAGVAGLFLLAVIAAWTALSSPPAPAPANGPGGYFRRVEESEQLLLQTRQMDQMAMRAKLQEIAERYPELPAGRIASAILASRVPEKEAEAGRLHAELLMADPNRRTKLESELAKQFPETAFGRLAAERLAEERAASEARRRQAEAEARKRREAEKKKAAEEARKRLEAQAAKQLESILALKGKDPARYRRELQAFNRNRKFKNTPAANKAATAWNTLMEAEAETRRNEKARSAWNERRRKIALLLGRGRLTDAEELATEFLKHDKYAILHPQARALAADCRMLLSFKDLVLKGLRKLVGQPVRLVMERGQVHAGTLVELESGEEPRFVLMNERDKRIPRQVKSLDDGCKLEIAQIAVEGPEYRKHVLAGYVNLLKRKYEDSAAAFKAAAEAGDPFQDEYRAIFKTIHAANTEAEEP